MVFFDDKLIRLRTVAAVASVLLSLWCLYQDDVINSDGVLYLVASELISEGQWGAALQVYNWPFYSLLISLVSRIGGLSAEVSAHLINTLLYVLIVVAFISLVREFSTDRRILVTAALTVLIFPTLNAYRDYVIRDTGYIAFYLLAVVLFVRYSRDGRWSQAAGWSASMLLAALFRIEGIIFLLLLPFALLFGRGIPVPVRLRMFAGSQALLLLLVFVLAMLLATGTDFTAYGPGKLADLGVYLDRLAGLSGKAGILTQEYLSHYARGYAWPVVIATLVIILAGEIIFTLTPLYTLAAGHAMFARLFRPRGWLLHIWVWLLVVNLAVLIVFLLKEFFLTGRYPLALAVTVMVTVPFSAVYVYERWHGNTRTGGRRWATIALLALVVYTGLDGLISTAPSKAYIRAAAGWIREHSVPGDTVLSNDLVLSYYTGRLPDNDDGIIRPQRYTWEETWNAVRDGRWRLYGFLAIRVSRKHPEREQQIIETTGMSPAMEFGNRRGDKALIFRVGRDAPTHRAAPARP